jgi:hypothetical protein
MNTEFTLHLVVPEKNQVKKTEVVIPEGRPRIGVPDLTCTVSHPVACRIKNLPGSPGNLWACRFFTRKNR